MQADPPSRVPRRVRLLRLTGFACLAGIVAYAGVNIGLAWIYAHALTHPGCRAEPVPLSGVSPPEEVWLETRDGLSLRSWYYPGQNGAAILTLGGMGGTLGESPPPVEFLIQEGYGILQIDSRACAQPAAHVTLGAKELWDGEAGLVFLEGLPEVDAIGVFGFSMGASTAIRLAARHETIAAVVAEGGYFNLGDDFVEPDQGENLPRRVFLYSIAWSYWLQSGVNPWMVSPIEDLPEISPRPVFLIYGEGEAASGRAMNQYAAAKDPKTLWIVPGGGHGANYAASPGEYRRRISEFFASGLSVQDY